MGKHHETCISFWGSRHLLYNQMHLKAYVLVHRCSTVVKSMKTVPSFKKHIDQSINGVTDFGCAIGGRRSLCEAAVGSVESYHPVEATTPDACVSNRSLLHICLRLHMLVGYKCGKGENWTLETPFYTYYRDLPSPYFPTKRVLFSDLPLLTPAPPPEPGSPRCPTSRLGGRWARAAAPA